MIDRTSLATFLRRRRESLQPGDVGLPRGERRRTGGLRREEVAALCHMSTDYYSRLEQGRQSRPSARLIASIAQGLHLTLDERDQLFRLAGHRPPPPGSGGDHVSPGLLRILDRLGDTPAEIVTELGETLRQNRLGVALTGNLTNYRGPARSIAYRWFIDPAARGLYRPDDHAFMSRLFVSATREAAVLRGPDSRAAGLAELLLTRSAEFRVLWEDRTVGVRPREVQRFVHPKVGRLDLIGHHLIDPSQPHRLLFYTAVPGTESYDKLRLLAVVGVQSFLTWPGSKGGLPRL
ncbi:MAG: helix-turn-helix transcriptional regulator [Actinomycetota bacterium]|nr:helix-turn-helix transcriptional regulator [Actinomycetota bacterium]